MQPLALDRHLRIQALPALGVEADLAVVLALLGDLQAQDAVVCTHGEVIGQALVRLVADGLMVDQPLAWPKGSTWLLEGADRRFTFGRYLPPLRLADALTPPSVPQAAPVNGLAHTGQQAHRPGATLLSMTRYEEM